MKTYNWIHLQSWTKYLEQRKEIKQNWLVPETSGICYCAIFDCYYQNFVSGRETRHCALSPPKFGIALIVTNFLRSKVL